MLITTVKPLAVAVVLPYVGVNAADSEVSVTSAVPPTYPSRVVVIVAVELVLAATPVMVAKPVLLLIATVPDAVAVPAQL